MIIWTGGKIKRIFEHKFGISLNNDEIIKNFAALGDQTLLNNTH